MTLPDHYMQEKFGIDEIYIHDGLSSNLLEKLYQRSLFSVDADDPIIQKYAHHDFVLLFHKATPTPGLVYRFLKFLEKSEAKEHFIKSNTLINEEELFLSIKSKRFVLVTNKTLVKKEHIPV